MTWIIVASVIATLVGGLLALNFATPEKKLQHIPKHLYDVADPQFKRRFYPIAHGFGKGKAFHHAPWCAR